MDGDPYLSEWPFNEDSDTVLPISSRSSLRFLVVQSPVLPPRRKIAVLEVHDEVQIGRDASTSELTSRLRLKDMEVSKLHATVFWDKDREEWAIVDMGSKHGTFLIRSASNSSSSTRLSASRASSLPRPLRHLDQLSFGRTTFAVHIHPEGVPCEDCSSLDEFAIISLSSKFGSSQRQLDAQPEPETTTSIANAATTSARDALGTLKRRLLSEHAVPDSKRLKASDESRTRYVDRSSLRRALHPPSRDPISLPVPAARPSSINYPPHALTVARYHMQATSDISPPDPSLAQLQAAIPKSNVGHRLLEKQGWSPGAALGQVPSDFALDPANARRALLEPLQVPANVGKLGLGSSVRRRSRDDSAALKEADLK